MPPTEPMYRRDIMEKIKDNLKIIKVSDWIPVTSRWCFMLGAACVFLGYGAVPHSPQAVTALTSQGIPEERQARGHSTSEA